jgi:hypothetical protein
MVSKHFLSLGVQFSLCRLKKSESGEKLNLARLFSHAYRSVSKQRAILNFTPGPQGRTSPLGVNMAPSGVICPLGGMFTPSLWGEHSLLFRRMEGRTENFTLGDNFIPRGQNSPLGDKFTPGGQIHPWGQSLPLGAKLRMGLRMAQYRHLKFQLRLE